MGCHIEEGLVLYGWAPMDKYLIGRLKLNVRTTLSRTQVKRNSTLRDGGFVHHWRTNGDFMVVTEMFWRQLADQPGSRSLHWMVSLRSLSIWRCDFWRDPDMKTFAPLGRDCPVVSDSFLKENNLYISPNTSGFVETISFLSPIILSSLFLD